MELKVYNIAGEEVGQVEVSDAIFGTEVKTHLLWELVRWQRAKRRRGTHSTKTRHFVRGSGKKAYRQKGTGRARHGDYQAPIFVGGGIAHGPKPRDYSFKVNKKVRAAALRSALSQKVADQKLTVVDNFELPEIKTRRAISALNALNAAHKPLVVDGENDALFRSVRNVPGAKYLNVDGLNIYDLLNHDAVVFTRAALDAIEGRLAK